MQGKEKRPMGGTRSIKIPLQEVVCIICPGKGTDTGRLSNEAGNGDGEKSQGALKATLTSFCR